MISIICRCAGPSVAQSWRGRMSRCMPNVASTRFVLLFERTPVEQDAANVGHVADEDVFSDRQVGDDLGFLVDDADAGGMAVARLVEDNGRAAMADDRRCPA